jgi:hypothetical protein
MHAKPPESPSVLGKRPIEKADVLGASGKRARGPTRNITMIKQRPKKHVVYFVRAETGVIKIGTTGDIEWRMKSLRGQSPVALTLLATVRGGRVREHQYHDQFAAHRLHGEWFSPAPEINAEIARIKGPVARRRTGYERSGLE